MILLYTSGLLAAIDGSQHHHAACAAALKRARPPLLLSPFVLAELDYLLARHAGAGAQGALLVADAYLVALAARHNTRDILTLDERHFRALRIGSRKRFRLLPADQ